MHCIANTEAQGIPLPAMLAAVWGGFLYEGLLTHSPDIKRTRVILDAWSHGCIELVIAACVHLPELWEQISATWNESDADFPGVFEYEVVSPLGEFIGDYLLSHKGQMPDAEVVRQEIQKLIQQFLSSKAA